MLLNTRITIQSCLILVVLAGGCQKADPPSFRLNSVEIIKQERLNLKEGETFDPAYREQIGTLMTSLFGTPDDPKFPYLAGDDDPARAVVNLARLKQAAGAVSSDRFNEHVGLYREHCVHCHGITGDGAGPTAATLGPYPRDFRLGKFKFKSTPLRRPPTDNDLVRVLKNGIPGTAMPAFSVLSEEDLLALVDYVKYLSIRGEFERRLISELPNLEGQPLVDLSLLSKKTDAAERKKLDDQLYAVVGEFLTEDVIARWLDREDSISEVSTPPASLVDTDTAHAEFVDVGRKLFYTKANCVQCHGATGLGDGQTQNYDDWANEWIKTPGVDVLEPKTYQHFMTAGALPPQKIRPRNLRLPVYRGGNSIADLYRRIANGIEGTPMPSSPTLTPEEVWALVAYVQSMPYESNASAQTNAAPTVTKRAR